MRVSIFSALFLAAAVAACAKSGDTAVDTTAGTTGAAGGDVVAPAAISLADVAGTWNVRAVPIGGTDTTATTYVLSAAADTAGWKITYPNGTVVPVHVRVDGDSVLTQSGPYASVRRKGMQVTTDGAFRLQDGKLVGHAIAHYKTTGADSVLHLRMEGTKAP